MGNGKWEIGNREWGKVELTSVPHTGAKHVTALSHFQSPISYFLVQTIAIGLTIEPVAPMNLSGVQINVEIQASASERALRHRFSMM